MGDEHELIEKVSEMVQSAKDAHEDRDLRLLKELLVYEQSVKYDLEVFELTNDRASLIDACNDWWTLFLEALFKIYENV